MKHGADGFTILETVIALFLVAVGVLATAPLFVYAAEENASGTDLVNVGTLAVQRLEIMRSTDYENLLPGGSLVADVNGYFDDSNPDYIVRWTIQNATIAGLRRRIVVQVTANRAVRGQPKEFTLTTSRSI